MTRLTTTQAKVLEFIRSSVERVGVAPTLREICLHMGYKAVGSAQDVVTALRRKGFIEENTKHSARAFVLTSMARREHSSREDSEDDGSTDAFMVPLLGKVPAGNPALAVEERIGRLRVSLSLLAKPSPRREDLFALQATGDSMTGAGILDGDFLVVRLNKEPAKGSIVVARVEGDVTVKRLLQDRHRGWYLKPENPSFANIYATSERFEIVGQVVALQRALL